MKLFTTLKAAVLTVLLMTVRSSHAQTCDDYLYEMRILVAYSNSVANAYPNPLQSIIQPSIDNINLAFQNSGVNHRVRLVRAIHFNYDEADSLITSRNDFMQSDFIKNLRNVYHADVCVLVTTTGRGAAGIGYGIGTTRLDAYLAMKDDYLGKKFTMAHEMGHLYGCRHELARDSNTEPYPYGHGYVFLSLKDAQSKYKHTIMAYGDVANPDVLTPPIPYFSNPDSTYSGFVLGSAATSNETKVFNKAYNRMKGYQAGVGAIPRTYLVEAITIRQDETVQAYEVSDVNAQGLLATGSGYNYVINANGNAVFRCHPDQTTNTASIDLKPGFHAYTGSSFRAYICFDSGICSEGSDDGSCPVSGTSPRTKPAKATNENINSSNIHISPATIYPNPFTRHVTISYALTSQQKVSLFIYDINGRQITTLIAGELQTEGRHQVVFNAANLAAGVYVYQLITDGKVQTGKIVKAE